MEFYLPDWLYKKVRQKMRENPPPLTREKNKTNKQNNEKQTRIVAEEDKSCHRMSLQITIYNTIVDRS